MKVQWLLPFLALPLWTIAACHPAAPPPPVDDTAKDAAAQPDPAPKPSVKPAIPARLRATGTEPFWGAVIDGTVLTYSTPEFPNGIRITVSRADKPGSAVFAGVLDGKPLTLTVAPGTCSDGMSDKVYSFTALREIGPDSARGCADPQ